MKLSEKIMILRKQKGWSQEELAEKLEVSRQAVSKWESGQASPDIEKILKISQLFEVSTDVLLKEEYDVYATEEAKELEPIPSAPHTTPTSLTIFRSAFWPLMVAVYLVYSFFTDDWGRSWIIWPIAAVLFTLINVIWSVAIKVEIKDD